MQVVFFTSSFPAAVGGVDMVLVRRARELARLAGLVAVVPTPWAPRVAAAVSSRWAGYARLPRESTLDGVAVIRPRYAQIPGSGAWAGIPMAVGALATVRRLRAQGRCDVLFAQNLVPDGLAAVLLARWTGVPAACLGRGTDVHDVARSRAARAAVAYTVRRASAVAVVAHRLAATLDAVARGRQVAVLPDGVDLERFRPGDRVAARRALGLPAAAQIVGYVGRLVPGKGIEALVDALPDLAGARLVLAGDGPLAGAIAARARELGVADRVHLAGEVAHERVPLWMQAADVIALPSVAEGFPNSVREALACGRPIVATPVGDLPSVVTPDVGRLVPVGDRGALVEALADALAATWDASAIRAHVADMSWHANARATHDFLGAAIGAAASISARAPESGGSPPFAARDVPGPRRTAAGPDRG
jgi:glycosyltransferase involved in cell wall biosynthesis